MLWSRLHDHLYSRHAFTTSVPKHFNADFYKLMFNYIHSHFFWQCEVCGILLMLSWCHYGGAGLLAALK